MAQKFGKFILLEKIASGGMAEIFMAKTEGPGGFEKIVALKRILPELCHNQEFISMFIDEAKTTSQLTHSNIAHIFEFGHEKGAGEAKNYYLSMEFVEGKHLRQILSRADELQKLISIENALYIASKICAGLDYAHRFQNRRGGDVLQIIHRDISPQNILLSYEGEIKLIDFGIAKTRAKSGKTKAGVLKGKFGYMSPEQALGETLDQRTDIFSCGIILFEMLTHQRLFQSANDLSTLKKIQEAKIPAPSLFNPHISHELEEVVLKALEKDKNKRYPTAGELDRDLSHLLYTLNPHYTSHELAIYLKSLFSEEIIAHKKKIHDILISLEKPLPSLKSEEPVTQLKTMEKETPEEYPAKKMWLQIGILGLLFVTLSLLLLLLNQKPERMIQSTLLEESHLPELSLTTPSPPITKTLNEEGIGYITIQTIPDNIVKIDGVLIGRSPIIEYELKVGKHRIQVMNEESKTFAEREIEIEEGEVEFVDEKDLVFQQKVPASVE